MPEERNMVDMRLGRIVIREGSDRQYIYLMERAGPRTFSIVIGTNEALEIRRVVVGDEVERPLTHQLAHSAIRALGAEVQRCDITDLRQNTYYAQLVLRSEEGDRTVDARPSDAIALAMRAGAPIRIVEHVLEQVRIDNEGADPLPEEPK